MSYTKHQHEWKCEDLFTDTHIDSCQKCTLVKMEAPTETLISFRWEKQTYITAQILLEVALLITAEKIPGRVVVEWIQGGKNEYGDSIDYVEVRFRW